MVQWVALLLPKGGVVNSNLSQSRLFILKSSQTIGPPYLNGNMVASEVGDAEGSLGAVFSSLPHLCVAWLK